MYGYGNGWGMMGDGYGSMGGFNMVFWLLAFVLLTGAVVWFMRSSSSIGLRRQAGAALPGGLDVLERRYASGEINREEYLQKKGDLQA
jgi:putative membrane protein